MKSTNQPIKSNQIKSNDLNNGSNSKSFLLNDKTFKIILITNTYDNIVEYVKYYQEK